MANPQEKALSSFTKQSNLWKKFIKAISPKRHIKEIADDAAETFAKKQVDVVSESLDKAKGAVSEIFSPEAINPRIEAIVPKLMDTVTGGIKGSIKDISKELSPHISKAKRNLVIAGVGIPALGGSSFAITKKILDGKPKVDEGNSDIIRLIERLSVPLAAGVGAGVVASKMRSKSDDDKVEKKAFLNWFVDTDKIAQNAMQKYMPQIKKQIAPYYMMNLAAPFMANMMQKRPINKTIIKHVYHGAPQMPKMPNMMANKKFTYSPF